ncbi:MAG: hemin uptake protein HemP [Hyphomicrobium sp.]|nr:hemin uptake protein HemP [Hyphomicrobium sp.]
MTTAAEERHHAKPPAETAADTHDRRVRVLVSDILQGGREAILEHDGQDYRLRITANGKLILTK